MRATLDVRDVKRAADAMKGRFPAVVKRVLKRSATSGRAEMARAIAKDTGLPSTKIKEEIKVVYVGLAGVQLEVRGRRLPLIAFGARGPEPSKGKGRGVSYRLPGGRGRVGDAFIATMSSGHRGVFRRTSRSRKPIIELFGPSLVKVFEKFLPQGTAKAQEALVKNMRSEIAFALERR